MMTIIKTRNIKAKVTAPPTGFGVNAGGISDFNVAQPFINLALTARGPLKGSTGGGSDVDYLPKTDLDERNYPFQLSNGELSYRLLWTWGSEIPSDGRARLAGDYTMTWVGSATVVIQGATNVVVGANIATFTLTLPTTAMIRISSLAPGNHLRDLVICRNDQLPLLNTGAVFRQDYQDLFREAQYMRFMDWGRTNGSTTVSWSQRTLPGGFRGSDGVAKEYMIRMANDLGVNPWFCIPHLADDDYIRQFAQLVRDTLNPNLVAHIEYSNEMWNFAFPQTQWAISAPLAAGWTNEGSNYQSWYAKKAVNVMQIWRDVFSAPGSPKLRCIAGTQAVSTSVSTNVLTAPRWLANEPENYVLPASVFDALAITSYFGTGIRTTFDKFNTLLDRIDRNDDPIGWTLAELSADIVSLDAKWTAQKVVADQYGLVLNGYEGGTHFLHEFAVSNGSPASAELLGNGTQSSFTFALQTSPHPRFWRLIFTLRDVTNGVDLPFVEGTHYTYSGTVDGGTITFLGGNLAANYRVRASKALTPEAEAQWVNFGSEFSYSESMGQLYDQAIAAWQSVTREGFPEFSDVGRPSKFGAWTMYRFVGDSNPRSQSIISNTALVGVA